MKFKFLFILLFLVLVSGCGNSSYEITEEDIFLTNILYEHTVMMIELSTPEQIKSLGIDSSNLVRNELMTPIHKVNLLEKAFHLDLGNKRFDKKLKILEDKMVEMMVNWSYE